MLGFQTTHVADRVEPRLGETGACSSAAFDVTTREGLAAIAATRERFFDDPGTDLSGIANRLVYAFIGASYATLALSALRLAQGEGGGHNQDTSAQDWTAWLLSQPFGQVLVAAFGVAVLAVAAVQFWMAYSEKCCESLRASELSETQERLVRLAGRVGFTARGVSFGIIGLLLIVAAVHARADEARGLGGALAALAHQPFGPWLLGAVAVGLVCYGLFMLVQARYRRLVVR